MTSVFSSYFTLGFFFFFLTISREIADYQVQGRARGDRLPGFESRFQASLAVQLCLHSAVSLCSCFLLGKTETVTVPTPEWWFGFGMCLGARVVMG